jgi:hypothetical protein
MKENNATRKSHCSICGKRLSEKTASSTIRWEAGHVDDTGIYCDSCYTSKLNPFSSISEDKKVT